MGECAESVAASCKRYALGENGPSNLIGAGSSQFRENVLEIGVKNKRPSERWKKGNGKRILAIERK